MPLPGEGLRTAPGDTVPESSRGQLSGMWREDPLLLLWSRDLCVLCSLLSFPGGGFISRNWFSPRHYEGYVEVFEFTTSHRWPGKGGRKVVWLLGGLVNNDYANHQQMLEFESVIPNLGSWLSGLIPASHHSTAPVNYTRVLTLSLYLMSSILVCSSQTPEMLLTSNSV